MMRFLKIAALLASTPVLAANYAENLSQRLSDPLLHQPLVTSANYAKVIKIAETYRKRNSLNVGWLNLFRTWNSGETLQNRTALESKRSAATMIFEMDRGTPLDWSTVSLDAEGNPSTSSAEAAIALDTTHIRNPHAPVVLILLSNQHTLNDYLSNGAAAEVRKLGVILAVMEYPGYGISIGQGSRDSWIEATQSAARYLSYLAGKKVFLLGHSVGGPLALQVAATDGANAYLAGAMSYGGFTHLKEQAKDQDTNPVVMKLAPVIAGLTVGKNMIDGISGLETLAKNGIPALIMHGENDGPVPVRHTYLYEKKIQKLRARGVHGRLHTKVFPGMAHEEVNNFTAGIAQSESDFLTIWTEILGFMAGS